MLVDRSPLYGVKINEAYYRNVMLLQQFLLAVRQISSKFFVFQQDSAPKHTALRQSDFFPVTSPDIEQFEKFFQSRLSNKFVIKSYLEVSLDPNPIIPCDRKSHDILHVVSVFLTQIFHKLV